MRALLYVESDVGTWRIPVKVIAKAAASSGTCALTLAENPPPLMFTEAGIIHRVYVKVKGIGEIDMHTAKVQMGVGGTFNIQS
jgi:hypothetical protein